MNTSRRKFLHTVACSSALASLNGITPSALASRTAPSSALRSGFAYIGSYAGRAEAPGNTSAIYVFGIRGNQWNLKQTVASRNPAFLALHPSNRFLYAVNHVDSHDGLPCGTVEAYRIDPEDGRLSIINRQPLSLSAIFPRHLAISPDGSHLVVAAYGGGAYNLLPIEANGALGRVIGRWKETGSGSHPVHQASAHPHTVLFDPAGRYFLASDQGCDRLSTFNLHEGSFRRTYQAQLSAGSGHTVLNPSGSLLFVSNALDASITSYRLHASTGELRDRVCSVKPPGAHAGEFHDGNALALHPQGHILYSTCAFERSGRRTESISSWKIDAVCGDLSLIQTRDGDWRSLRSLVSAADGLALLVLDHDQGSVICLDTDAGTLGPARIVAHLPTPVSMAVRTCDTDKMAEHAASWSNRSS
jgi:6-phosphogluconolactonase